MTKKVENQNKIQNPKLGISDVMCSGYAIRFNEADTNGIIINKDAINIKDFEQMKVAGTIVDYEIDDNGVKIIKKFDLSSVYLSKPLLITLNVWHETVLPT